MLRHVEAFRLYAAEKGWLPDSLADVGVPLPVDPVTGRSFPYRVAGRKGILRGSPPRGREKNADYNVQFEVAIR